MAESSHGDHLITSLSKFSDTAVMLDTAAGGPKNKRTQQASEIYGLRFNDASKIES